MTARDLGSSRPLAVEPVGEGRRVVAVIGIDRYRGWPPLSNAVRDAHGALALFERCGFAPITPPLLDEAATGEAIRRLVTDDLATLGSSDSLVVFFAGHGHTQTRTLHSGPVETGYLIPVDGDRPHGRTASWLRLDSWLSDIARLPARHILVILDACHSGIALGSLIKWRDSGETHRGALDELRRRQSRRVITSALGDQRAMDSGPLHGHSLFTGCLIDALTGGLVRDGRHEVTASEIGLYVQQRVASYTESRQTPDFGALELDQRGELVVSLASAARADVPVAPAGSPTPPTPPTHGGLFGHMVDWWRTELPAWNRRIVVGGALLFMTCVAMTARLGSKGADNHTSGGAPSPSSAPPPAAPPASVAAAPANAKPPAKPTASWADAAAQRQAERANAPFPSCVDVLPNVFEWPGLLPIGIPRSWAPNFVTIRHVRGGPTAAIPIIVDGDPLVFEPRIEDGKLVVSRPTGIERQRLEVHKIDVPPDPEDHGDPFSSYHVEAAVGERSIAVTAEGSRRVFLIVIDKKTWTVRRMTKLTADPGEHYKPVRGHVAAGGGMFGVTAVLEKRPFDSADPLEWAFETFDEDGVLRGKPLLFDTSHQIAPRLVWTGKTFAVLAGRAGDIEPRSLGIYTMPAKDGGATYMGWIEPAESISDQRDLQIGGVLLWDKGSYHVAMFVPERGSYRRDGEVQIVHADPAGHVRIESCPDVKLRDD